LRTKFLSLKVTLAAQMKKKRKVKIRTLENYEDAAPKIVSPLDLLATRPSGIWNLESGPLALNVSATRHSFISIGTLRVILNCE
jgi:hypothetical protein